MISNQIKPSYAEDIAHFVQNGGVITQAVNTNKVEFNPKGGIQDIQPRKEAELKGLSSYVTYESCAKCGTSERSVKTNACLACDRRRSRARTGLTNKSLQEIGHYLLAKNEVVEFTSNGRKYILKVESV